MSHIGLRLFTENGFDETTVDQIAAAAGIGRRTFFRYFPSKNDLPWGDFDTMVAEMREYLFALPADLGLRDCLRLACLEFNRFPESETPFHRARMRMLLNVPSLVAHSALRYASWRGVVADFAALRLGVAADDLVPQTVAWAYLATCMSAYDQWLRHDDADLLALLEQSFTVLNQAFSLEPTAI